MAKVTIVIEDTGTNGLVSVVADYDPSLTRDGPMTTAQQLGRQIIEGLTSAADEIVSSEQS